MQIKMQIQFVLACVFAANWVFWLWIAQDRWSYVFSGTTLVDLVTIAPEFVLFGLAESSAVPWTAETLPSFNVLRVLRCVHAALSYSIQ
jgi:hypothetical protein